MDLFARSAAKDRRGQPLAERMRPVSLAEFVGQEQLLGPGKLLRRALEAKELPSLILWGPPGTGKTTLGRLLAAEAGARFVPMSAVMSGVKDLREAVAEAATHRDQRNERTVLFIDEIHRFNKAQQDALLPHVEAGTVVLVGATTENPSFEVNAALLSRAKVVVLRALSEADLRVVIDRALADKERGLGTQPLDVADDVRDLVAREARGDARRALVTLEAAAAVAVPDAAGRKLVTPAVIEEAMQKRTLLYDKAGDEHYGVVSAFIKSMRGSDPDAAVYWMARMVEAGEDPLFVLRRMVIFAAEDVGVADPRALSVATAAVDAFRFVGMPEGLIPMTEAAIYLATAPKTNTAITTYAAAKADVDAHGALAVPNHIRNAPTPLAKQLGWGAGYQYPHDFTGHYVREEYLPEAIRGHKYYQPSDSGHEREIAERLAKLRADKGGGPERGRGLTQMFGFGKPDVPPDEVVDWLFLAFAWLLRETGGWYAFSHRRLVLPTPEFFPIEGDGALLAKGLLTYVKRHAGMDEWPVRLEEHEDDPSREELFGRIALDGSDHGGAAGTFRGHGGAGQTSIITYSPKLLTEPAKLVATLAHEIGHYLLADVKTAPPGGWEWEERATDVCAVFLGFGVFLANSAFTFGQWSDGRWQGWQSSRLGYLNEQTLAYALGIFLLLRELEAKPALRHLDENPKSYLKDALVDLDRRRAGSLLALRPVS